MLKFLSGRPDWRYALLTGASAALCYWLTLLMGFGTGYWAAISSIVVCQSEVGATLIASRDRLVGTAIGVLVGWGTVLIWHQRIAVFGLAVVLTIILCNLCGFKVAGRLAGVAVCIVVLVPHKGTDAAHIAMSRFLEVAFGIMVALVMTAIFYPKNVLRAVAAPPAS